MQLHHRSREWVAEILTEGEIRLDYLDATLTLDVVYDEVEGLG